MLQLASRLLFVALTASFAGPVAAQGGGGAGPIPGTGCRGYPRTFTNTDTPSIGDQFVARGSGVCAQIRGTDFVVVGMQETTPPVWSSQFTCSGFSCVQGCSVLVVEQGSYVTTIPSNRDLIGICFCVQGFCVVFTRPCFTLDQAVRVCITSRGS